MGLLGHIFGPNAADNLNNLGDGLGQAAAYFSGDWDAANAIGGQIAKLQAARAAQKAQEAQQAAITQALAHRGLSPDDIALALTNQDSIGSNFNAQFKPQEPTTQQREVTESAKWTPEDWARHGALHPTTVMGPDGPQLVDPRAVLRTFGVGQQAPQPATPQQSSPFNAEQYRGLVNGLGQQGADAYMARHGFSATPKQVVRSGMHNGRRVVQYSDGTTEYAD